MLRGSRSLIAARAQAGRTPLAWPAAPLRRRPRRGRRRRRRCRARRPTRATRRGAAPCAPEARRNALRTPLRRRSRPARRPAAGRRGAARTKRPWFSASGVALSVEQRERVGERRIALRAAHRLRRRSRPSARPRTSTRAPNSSAAIARIASVACGDGVLPYGKTQSRAAAPRCSRSRRWKYGLSSGNGKRRAMRSERASRKSPSSTRGNTTKSSKLRAIRWIHGAAGAPPPVSPCAVRSAANAASSGSAIPDSCAAGASTVVTSACAMPGERNVLSQPAR